VKRRKQGAIQKPGKPELRCVQLTPEQRAMVADAERRLRGAQQTYLTIAAAIVAGHGLQRVRVVGLTEQGLVVELSPEQTVR